MSFAAILMANIIQPYFCLFWLLLVMHFGIRAMPIDDIDGKSHKM